jgi:predicted metalloprotease with PDZ domain
MIIETQAQTKIAFDVSFTEPQAHYVDVKMEVSALNNEYLEVKMPVWTPGSYLIREFARNVEGFTASDENGIILSSTKTTKNAWKIHTPKSKKVKINYRVYAFEISVRTSFVDMSHAFLSPTSIFMYVTGQLKQPATITIHPITAWTQISTGLETLQGKANSFYAPNFDILFDSPIEIGTQDIFEFDAAGVKHEVAMYGGGNYDKERLKRDMTKIVEEETTVFDVNPNKRYVFIVHNYNTSGGGLEHLNSTVLGMSRNSYTDENSYANFLSLVAHEYFHLWNVKRIRPFALGPFDYDNENYTTNLWIAEGFTAYYDNLMIRRTGFYSFEKYLEVLSGVINVIENQPGNRVQPVSEASFDAWIKAYRPNENSRNSTISYYDKGSMIALVLDLEILNATQGKKGLDDVMKALYDEYHIKQNRGYTDAEFKVLAEQVAGLPLDTIYNDYVNDTKQINFAKYFNYVGLQLVDDLATKNTPYLGTTSVVKEGKIIITTIARGSAAWTGGLNVNDEIIGIDENRVNDLDKMIATKKVGQKITLLINRDGLLKNIDATLTRNPTIKFRLVPAESANEAAVALRRKWLKL